MIKLGLTNDFILKPLTFWLESGELKHPFQMEWHLPAENARRLLHGELDIAVITPLEYAFHSSELKLYPHLGVVSTHESRMALLFFHENLLSFRNVLYPLPEDIYYHITRIALMEFYEMEIEWEGREELPTTVTDALRGYDAALYTGNAALDAYVQYDTRLDMVEEWCDKSANPFVHLLIATHQDSKFSDEMEWFAQSLNLGLRNVLKIAEAYAQHHPNPASYYFEVIQEHYRYHLEPTDHQALKELFNYLYYYGVIEFLPELHWMD